MLNALDNLPEDPVELRRVTGLLASEVKAQALMIEKLQHQLHGANRHRFGSKSEGMDQLRLFAENEESTGLGRLAARQLLESGAGKAWHNVVETPWPSPSL